MSKLRNIANIMHNLPRRAFLSGDGVSLNETVEKIFKEIDLSQPDLFLEVRVEQTVGAGKHMPLMERYYDEHNEFLPADARVYFNQR